MRRSSLAFLTASTIAGVSAWDGNVAIHAQAPSREELVAKLGLSIGSFVRNLSSVVAEEAYHQEVSSPFRTRDLTSDFLLVRYPGADRLWLSFRDVLEVDGKPVRSDREERLSSLFLKPFDDAARRAREIARAGDRYDIARVAPLDDPLLALSMLQTKPMCSISSSRTCLMVLATVLTVADNGLLMMAAMMTLVLADRDEVGAEWVFARSEAHRHGSLLGISAITSLVFNVGPFR